MPKPSRLPISPSDPSSSPSKGGAAVETTPAPGERRRFTAAEKLRIVREAAGCTERGSIAALLRRERIYSSLLTSWRKELSLRGTQGLAGRTPGRKPKLDAKDRRIQELEKRAARLEAKLALAQKLIDLQKKASELLGIELASEEES